MPDRPLLLIVEDDPSTASLLETYFQSQGYRTNCIRHGEEAEPMAVERHPDLVLLDIRLPGMDGFEVARRLRSNRHTAAMPFLILSDMREHSDRMKGLSVGADDYIAKPFDLQELGLRVRNLVDRTRRKRTTNPVTGLPEGKLIEEALQRLLLQSEWSIVTIRVNGLDAFRSRHGFPVADDLMRILAASLEGAAAERLKVGVLVGHLAPDEFVVLSDSASLLEFSKEVSGKLHAQTVPGAPGSPVPLKAANLSPEISFQFRTISSADGSFGTWDALQAALEQTPARAL